MTGTKKAQWAAGRTALRPGDMSPGVDWYRYAHSFAMTMKGEVSTVMDQRKL